MSGVSRHAREEASPRAKANLLRGVLSGQLRVDDLTDDRAKAIADLCFNCHQCRLECPASVDIPKIVGELKAQYVATNGLPLVRCSDGAHRYGRRGDVQNSLAVEPADSTAIVALAR